MDTKFGKLISRDREGTLTEVYPEILVDDEVNFADRRSRHPVTNIGVANAIDSAINTAKDKIKEAFSSSNGGLGWDESIQKGYVDFSQMPNSEIESIVNSMVDPDGAIIADETTGKLTVDFSKLSAAQIMTLCLAGGGIVSDPSTGKLKIDFSAIDADTKRNITSSLKMQVPLTTNKRIYVDNVNGDDTYLDSNGIVVDGKGETTSTAFKTIQTAVNFATEQYAIGSKRIDIYLVANDDQPYQEYVTLPTYTRTSGAIHIHSADNAHRAKIVNSSASGRLFSCTGGAYTLQNLDLEAEYYAVNNGNPQYPGLVGAGSYGDIRLYGCHCKCSYAGPANADAWFSLRLFTSSGYGYLGFGLIAGSHNTIEYHKNNASDCIVIHCQSNGKIGFDSTGTSENITVDLPVSNEDEFNELLQTSPYNSFTTIESSISGNILVTGSTKNVRSFMDALGLGRDFWPYLKGECMYMLESWGECSTFCAASTGSLVRYGAGATFDQRFIVPEGKIATGKRFNVSTLSGIDMNTMIGSFPGDVAGTVDEATFAYAKTRNE